MKVIPLSRRSGLLPESRTLKILAEGRGRAKLDLCLGSGDLSPPEELLNTAARLMFAAKTHGYGATSGDLSLRKALADKARDQGLFYDPQDEIIVSAGASAALATVFQSILNPGDRIILPEPFYENFLGAIAVTGARPRYMSLEPGSWSLSAESLRKAWSPRCKAILLTNPHNPTGHVLRAEELALVADFCQQYNLLAIVDATYEPYIFGDNCAEESQLAALPGMRDRCIIVHSLSKVYNVPGWRVGSIMAPRHIAGAIARMNALTMGAPGPLQSALALNMGPTYRQYTKETVRFYRPLRDSLLSGLSQAGFNVCVPDGGLSVYADARPLGFEDSAVFCRLLESKLSLAALPGNAFMRPGKISSWVRFSFARNRETIDEAVAVLNSSQFREALGAVKP